MEEVGEPNPGVAIILSGCLSWAEDQTGSYLCLVRRSGFSGTQWSRLTTVRWTCPLSMFLCRRCRRTGCKTESRLRGKLLIHDTEQEIEVPKISSTVRPRRAVLAATQVAEQLVEVPWVSPSSCFLMPRMAEQLVDVPVVASQSEFHQHRVEQTAHTPVHGGGIWARRGLQGSRPGQDSTAFRGAEHLQQRSVEQNITI